MFLILKIARKLHTQNPLKIAGVASFNLGITKTGTKTNNVNTNRYLRFY